jgi:hypothetical protein
MPGKSQVSTGDIPSKHTQHYCRECTFVVPTTIGRKTSAHIEMYLHIFGKHLVSEMSLFCGRSCSTREQPEEQKRGVKLYGPGSARTTPLLTYETLEPEDDP